MQIFSNKENKLLVVSLFVVVIIFAIANLVEQENYPIMEGWYPTDILFVILPIIGIILGIIFSFMNKGQGYHGKAWILFSISMIFWFMGEMTYDYDVEYDIENISSLSSDIFYIIGYIVFLSFTIFYLITRKKSISKNMILIAGLGSILFVMPSLYFILENNEETDSLTIFLYGIYPILDGLILAPAIIAVMLFFKGQVNFLWILVLIATLFDILGDTLYLIFAVEEAYYPGHPLDMLFLFAYVFYAFGVYSHIKLYRN